FQQIRLEIYNCRSCAKMRELKTVLRDELYWTWRSSGFFGVDFILLVHEFEKLVIKAHRFGRSKNQQAAGVQGVVKLRDAALMQFRAEINQHIAAADYVEPREWWIRRDVLSRKRANIAHVAMNLVRTVAFNKKTVQSRARNVLLDRTRVNSQTRMLHHRLAQVGAE